MQGSLLEIKRTFIQTRPFTRSWTALGFNDEDLRRNDLENLTKEERNHLKKQIDILESNL